jgi:hypothetical protein
VREFFANVRFLAAASALAACGSVARPPANNTAGFGIRIFGRAFRIEGVTIQNCVQDGLWTEGNRAAFTDQAADLEPTVFRVRGIRNTGNGWTHRGPNDLSFKFNGGGANMQRRHRDHEGDRMLDRRRVARLPSAAGNTTRFQEPGALGGFFIGGWNPVFPASNATLQIGSAQAPRTAVDVAN